MVVMYASLRRAMLAMLLPLSFAACGDTAGPTRFAVALPAAGGRVGSSAAGIEVREVELPLYAELEEIYVAGADGALRSNTEVLWADDPRRSVTQSLALALTDLTGATVAAEPWPLGELPDARLEVRFDTLLARETGVFEASGQYFLASLDEGRDRTGRFAIAVPFDPTGPDAIADAKGRAIAQLAAQIAREAL